MDRREALKSVAFIMGGLTIGAELFLSSCQSKEKGIAEEANDSFTSTDVALMDEIAETIIPTTDTPGAKAAGVGSFMAVMLADCYEEKNQKAFKQGLEKIDMDFKDEFGSFFLEGKPEERFTFLHSLEKELRSYNHSKKEEDPAHYYGIMKELTLLGYFTSEIGSTQARRYLPVPGDYKGCIPYDFKDPAWSV